MYDAGNILICRCQRAKALPDQCVQTACEQLRQAGRSFLEVEDLCLLAQRRDPVLAQLSRRPVLVLACASRAVQWLLNWAGAEPAEGSVFLSLRDPGTPAKTSAFLDQPVSSAEPDANRGSSPLPEPVAAMPQEAAADAWPAWFPVIDQEACVNCKQCLGFCLFGVYSLDPAGRVQVSQPRNCKNLCPACARLCPKGAIIFPKYSQAPVNGEPSEEPASGPQALLKGDVIAELRRRAGQSPQQAQAIEKMLRQSLPDQVDPEKDGHGR